jgi:Flp pilus assembly protein TadG
MGRLMGEGPQEVSSSMASEFQPKARRLRGILSRLRRNQAGNVLILTAAFLIPALALIGSGVDLGRTYIARQRLQFACDAGSLAGRRAVAANQSDTVVKSEAVKFLTYNFPTQVYGTAAFASGQPTVTITGTSPKVVTVSANTTLPMTIMQMFGVSTMPISVTCSAQEDYVNTDVMLVLDNTLSMNCTPGSNANCSSSYEVSGSKMAGMRSAVMALYTALGTAQTQLQNAGLRLRYGAVPYSSTVNIGKLIYMSGDSNYGFLGQPGYFQSTSYYDGCGTKTSQGKTTADCTKYVYQPVTHDTNWFNNSWNGCVEERQSDNSINTSTSNIPSGAYDLNLDMVPTTGTSTSAMQTQWRPFDPSSVNLSTSGYGITASPCPSAAAALQPVTQSQIQAYVNSLVAGGGTLTDIGMIWAGRLLSQTGIWAGMNPTTYGNMPVNRYIILMTDGGVTAYSNYYTSYGVENLDHRASSNSANAATDTLNHRQRFNLICNAIKNEGVQIWVVGFGQSFTSSSTASADTTALQNCASSPSQASYVSDTNGLVAKFTEIGQTIGALRLTK